MKTLYSALFSTLMVLGLIALPFSSSMFGDTQTGTEPEEGIQQEINMSQDETGQENMDQSEVDKNAKGPETDMDQEDEDSDDMDSDDTDQQDSENKDDENKDKKSWSY